MVPHRTLLEAALSSGDLGRVQQLPVRSPRPPRTKPRDACGLTLGVSQPDDCGTWANRAASGAHAAGAIPMNILTVGEPYHPSRRQWPEGATYNFRAGAHELVLFFDRPTDRETGAIRRDRMDLAVTAEGDVIILSWRFGTAPWSDAPYSWHLLPEAERVEPATPEGNGALLSVVLVDASTGLVRAFRAVSMSAEFAAALEGSIREQILRPWPGREAYDRELARIYATSSSETIAGRAIARGVGGDAPEATHASRVAVAGPEHPAARIQRMISRMRSRYPQVWDTFERLRSMRGRGLPAWPDWCLLPLAGAYAIASGGGKRRPAHPEDVSIIAALGTWRYSQGIYQFDGNLLDALWETPAAGEMPTDVLTRLPEHCVYVATPGRNVGETESIGIEGFFAHMEWDSNDTHVELRLLVDCTDGGLIAIPIHLGSDLSEGLEVMLWEARRKASGSYGDEFLGGLGAAKIRPIVEPLVSTLLYL